MKPNAIMHSVLFFVLAVSISNAAIDFEYENTIETVEFSCKNKDNDKCDHYKNIINYHENGTVKEKYTELNGEAEGLYESYYDNGKLKFTCNLINGKMHGISKNFYKNGALESLNFWRFGKASGFSRSYDEDGDVVNDLMDSNLKIRYYKNGEIYQIAVDLGKKLSSETLIYMLVSEKTPEQKLKDDTMWYREAIPAESFELFEYSKEGVLKEIENYKDWDKIKDGTSIEYHPNGRVKKQLLYADGVLKSYMEFDDQGNFIKLWTAEETKADKKKSNSSTKNMENKLRSCHVQRNYSRYRDTV